MLFHPGIYSPSLAAYWASTIQTIICGDDKPVAITSWLKSNEYLLLLHQHCINIEDSKMQLVDASDEQKTLQTLEDMVEAFNIQHKPTLQSLGFQASLNYLIPPSDNSFKYIDFYPSKDQELNAGITSFMR